ncbi:uncharacterized protein STEHIDRAFT_153613 [Stereum hirsutum FP-91666 SS1]|uniref:uncharacterized protein n=1 Tax=Stereum hirsutum (strain FP-91666) TaxID=721885 RepID=UPI0004409FC2|nr:uncharacterized protein STEHIDRAFT_153613 [Stereum hirsutum FP-91666 SS1]EIM89772.1 hypothetical protein STEHIDRAFT_153613 [Stereum hirsutum FP-91666 SS1]
MSSSSAIILNRPFDAHIQVRIEAIVNIAADSNEAVIYYRYSFILHHQETVTPAGANAARRGLGALRRDVGRHRLPASILGHQMHGRVFESPYERGREL